MAYLERHDGLAGPPKKDLSAKGSMSRQRIARRNQEAADRIRWIADRAISQVPGQATPLYANAGTGPRFDAQTGERLPDASSYYLQPFVPYRPAAPSPFDPGARKPLTPFSPPEAYVPEPAQPAPPPVMQTIGAAPATIPMPDSPFNVTSREIVMAPRSTYNLPGVSRAGAFMLGMNGLTERF